MMNAKDNLGVALVKELCPICCKEMDGPIIMNKRLTKPCKEKVESMHNKIIGFADHCCKECAKHKDDVVFFIGIDEKKSDSNSMETIYRTGEIVGIKRNSSFINEAIKEFIITLNDDTQFIFMDENAGKRLGIFNKDSNA